MSTHNQLLQTSINLVSEENQFSALKEEEQQDFKSEWQKILNDNTQKTFKNLDHQKIKQKLELTSCISMNNDQVPIQYPVSFKKCLHFDKCMDFLQIFRLVKCEKVKKVECSCNQSAEVDQNFFSQLTVDPQFRFIFKKIHSTHQFVDLYQDKTFSKQQDRQKVFTSSQGTILEFMKKESQIQSNFSKESGQSKSNFSQFVPKEINQNFYFRVTCLLSQTKLYIPVRFRECKHLEVYDLMSLLIRCERNSNLQGKEKKTSFECQHPQCKCSIPLDKVKLIQAMGLDQELLNALLKGVPFSTNFEFNVQTKVVSDTLAGNHEDQFIQKLYGNNVVPIKILQEVWFKTSKVFAKRGDSNNQESSLENKLLDELTVDMRDVYTGILVEIPTRCKNCKDMNRVMELRSVMYQIQQAVNTQQSQFKCPLCSFELDSPFENQIMVDYDLYGHISRSIGQLQNDPVLKINGKENVKRIFNKAQKITLEDFINLEEVQRTKRIIFDKIKCQISQNKLKFPLIYGDCSHNYYFDFDSICEQYKKDQFKTLKLCQDCVGDQNNMNLTLGKFKYNECLKEFIEKNPQLTYIEYDIENNKFISKQSQNVNQVIQVTPQAKYSSMSDFLELPAEMKKIYGNQNYKGIEYKVMQSRFGDIKMDQNGIQTKEFIEKIQNTEKDIATKFNVQISVRGVSLGVNNQMLNIIDLKQKQQSQKEITQSKPPQQTQVQTTETTQTSVQQKLENINPQTAQPQNSFQQNLQIAPQENKSNDKSIRIVAKTNQQFKDLQQQEYVQQSAQIQNFDNPGKLNQQQQNSNQLIIINTGTIQAQQQPQNPPQPIQQFQQNKIQFINNYNPQNRPQPIQQSQPNQIQFINNFTHQNPSYPIQQQYPNQILFKNNFNPSNPSQPIQQQQQQTNQIQFINNYDPKKELILKQKSENVIVQDTVQQNNFQNTQLNQFEFQTNVKQDNIVSVNPTNIYQQPQNLNSFGNIPNQQIQEQKRFPPPQLYTNQQLGNSPYNQNQWQQPQKNDFQKIHNQEQGAIQQNMNIPEKQLVQ